MILVVASSVDRIASEFVRQAGNGATLLTPASLSRRGWRLTVPEREPPVAVVDSESIPSSEISAVVIRLPHISEAELPHISAADRSYVASEMQAFLFAFLSSLRCPMVNRPTPVCLAGPNWRQAQWVKAARCNGLVAGANTVQTPRAVSVVGDECFGASDPWLKKAACHLARSAGVQMLRIWYAGAECAPTFLSADLWPDISEPKIAAALMGLISAVVAA